MVSLEELGYNPFVAQHMHDFTEQGFNIARITEEYRGRYTIRSEQFEIPAEVAGRLMYRAETRLDYPAVGDWVAVTTYDGNTHAIIQEILPRRTVLVRKTPGKRTESQIIATNMDSVFILQALDREFNPRKLERYLVIVRESGAIPVILLSKEDLCPAEIIPLIVDEAKVVASNVPVIAYSIYKNEEIAYIASFIKPGLTFCLIGPSGVGKSSLINRLVGKELLVTGETRIYDAKGRHITAMRQLIVLEHGGILIDTPGMRELGLWNVSTSLDMTFNDIEELAVGCFFRNCTHTHEPNCAVRKAIEDGDLEEERFESYIRLHKEHEYLDKRKDHDALLDKKARDKKMSKQIKKILKHKGKNLTL
jgi:ribosome biogenesis GTPase